LGEVLWSGALAMRRDIGRALAREGILPILSRLVMETGEGPIAVRGALDGEGAFQLAHAASPSGEVERIVLNLWVELAGKRGRTHGPPPPGAGERISVGRVFAEHVFTRPFAPADARRVVRLPPPEPAAGDGADATTFSLWGPDGVPPARHAFAPAESLLELPDGADALDAALEVDPAPVVFGLGHTDSNQHVNSLVYPRLFEAAALRRVAAHGLDVARLPRSIEVGYRKPAFAGERAVVAARAFRLGDGFGVVGAFAPNLAARPSVTCRVLF
ncbi:MAG TPA: hypothetical protein VHB21_02800, partial [Minicystis sp.]|nr:hypothetical protein [Minicystis sp.]